MGYLPRYNHRREYESNLTFIRVEQGYTWKELSETAGVSIGCLVGFSNGMISPLYERGWRKYEVKDNVKKILKVLNVAISEVFPRYVCNLERGYYLTSSQILECSHSQQPRLLVGCRDAVSKALDILPVRMKKILRLRFFEGCSLEEISKLLNLTRERIRQIESKALKRIKDYEDYEDLEYFWEMLPKS